MTDVEPCFTCQSRVRISRQPIAGSGSMAAPTPDGARVCTNPDCPTNGPERSMADRV